MHRWRFAGRAPDRVRLAPPDLRLADPQIAHEIYSARFPLAGHLVDTGGLSPFQAGAENRNWKKALHSFRWLRHLTAAGNDLAAANSRALVADWIAGPGRKISGVAWEPAITAKRIIAWLQHSALILNGAELPFYRAFLRSLAVQIRYLRMAQHDMEPSTDRLRARIALAFACLSLPLSATALRAATRNLDLELDAQILPDGGHVSRNPSTLLELLADLLPLRQTYANQAEPPPQTLLTAIDRMLPALRFFRHTDGSIARFNGMGPTLPDRVNSILRHDDASAPPLLHAPHSGYDRLALGPTIIIADTGASPPPGAASGAHAGCLSFELSSGRSCFIVNCGVDSYGPVELRALARTTAAHSTVTLDDTSQGQFNHSARVQAVIGSPLLGGARRVTCQRIDGAEAQGFKARHNAYVPRYGIVHERELQLSREGTLLTGVDRLLQEPSATARPRDGTVALRFHVHPDVDIFAAEHGAIGLAAKSGLTWHFACQDAEARVEESIFFASNDGPRRASQIVVQTQLAQAAEIRWQFIRQAD